MNTMNLDTTNSNSETFNTLCKKLGERINGVENALICFQAYEAYNLMYPQTTQGKGNSSDRNASIPAFRNAAAEKSGVAVGTIDALLQVGKAIDPLTEDVKQTLASCSLGCWTRGLRKLATKQFDTNRADIITNFANEESIDPESARKNLETVLGMKEKSQGEHTVKAARTATTPMIEVNEPRGEEEEPQQHAEDESFEMKLGPFLVRVVVKTGEKEQVEALLTRWASENAPPASSTHLNGVATAAA